MSSAVLLIVFNRPEPTRKVFEAIRQARPQRLYVAADGPRTNAGDEAERCREVRRLSINVDWPCQLKTLFRTTNLGCRDGVSTAINWFFEYEEEGIILEDDCLPSSSFFLYCETMLERYRDDERVAQISGSNFIGSELAGRASYFFSNYPDIWGWATWRRSWRHFDVTMADWARRARSSNVIPVAAGDRMVEHYWQQIFENTWRGRIDTWDYQWIFSCWLSGALNIIPAINLIENIGYGGDATHTTHPAPSFLKKAGQLTFPLMHPLQVEASCDADRLISKVRYEISILARMKSIFRKIPVLSGLMRSVKRGMSRSL